MIMRLPKPMGMFIDREQPVTFTFEGKSYQGFAGDTITSALLANNCWLHSRSFKYHRPRGPLTMAGQDANTLMQIGGEPNVLADKRRISNNMAVFGQNYSGSLENDRDAMLGWFSKFMPVGFYYRSFFKLPMLQKVATWKMWEPMIRRKAGLGVLDLDFKPEYYDKAYLFFDVTVVGAGPAGMQAAITAANAGASVLLVDENPSIGGSLTYHRFDLDGELAGRQLAELTASVESHPRIKVMTNATCNAWFTDNYLPVIQGKRMYKVRAKQCIVASGSFEQHVVFRNNDLPGVVMTSAAMRMMQHYAIKPGNRAVLLTGNDDAYLNALQLADHGVEVAAIVDMRPGPEDITLVDALKMRNIEVILGSTVYEAIPTSGNKHVRAVDVRRITSTGTVGDDNNRVINCDLVCMSAGYMPAYQLVCQAGAQLSYSDERAEFSLTKLPKHLHVAGSVNSIHTLQAVLCDGERAAIAACQALGFKASAVLINSPCERKVNFGWPIFPHPKGKDFVDFDEDLQSADIVNATRIGYRDIQLVKRYSTVGMGPSQGRHSALPTARLVAKATDRSVSETGVTTARPPYGPEKLSHIAGRGFDPYRRTAMHKRHVELGAQMLPAGNWQRPAFYGAAAARLQCIRDEAVNVRQGVGIIDVSTLGGIELRGPDAAEMINRIYTYGFLKQPVGKTRYAVMVSEQGVVVDDGVACRIGDEHFYVTATTSGVDRVYREMMRWNAQWRLNVDIANVTSAFAAVNLAGPLSRQVLSKLVNNVDLSNTAFPYLGYREMTVAGIPARLLRVGFVGELGYEIHVPASHGEALWDALMDAGKDFGIKPFGVEAQRLLRLEKGHIIVGQDTDGMSHPGEVSLAWAINRNKPFFIGCRSVDIVMAQPQSRKLVGFSLPADSAKPEEGHLVLEGDNISGNVTSCEYSPNIEAIIGLAYVGINQANPGDRFPIRVKGGEIVNALVVELPFYDSENARQQIEQEVE